MADIKVSAMAAAGSVSDSDVLYVVQSGVSRRMTRAQFTAGLASSDSPTFTGTVTLPSGLSGLLKAASGVVSAASGGTDYLAPAGNGSQLTGITVAQVSGAAPLASPTFTGTVTLPTGLSGLVKASSGIVSVAGAGTDYLAPDGDASRVVGRDAYEILRDRTYGTIIRVTTTIADALAAAAAATPAWYNRVLIYIPDGTYAESISLINKPWIDLMGESRSGTVLTGTGTADTIYTGGCNTLIGNMTVRSTPSGTPYYGIHCDATTTPTLLGAQTVVWRCTVESLGANAKSAIGIGLYGAHRLYLIDSSFASDRYAGIYGHNATGVGTPCHLYVLNCTSVGAASPAAAGYGCGLLWVNQGSLAPDRIVVRGGSLTGGEHGISVIDGTGGASETWVSVEGATYTDLSLVDPAKRLKFPALPMRLQSLEPQSPPIQGRVVSAIDGASIEANGAFRTLRSDKSLYLANADGNIGHFNTGSFQSDNATGFLLALTADGKAYIEGYTSGGVRRIRMANNNKLLLESDDNGFLIAHSGLQVQGGGVKMVSGTAAPGSGTWAVGDVVWNTAVASGQPEGWRCTTGGTPGTWSAMGNHP